MNPYYFLFSIGIVWTVFAVVQDLRTKEIANWLNFSLLFFALTYRGFYSLVFNDYKFFLIGLAGFGLFFVVSRIFYYGWAFAGGDVKLLTAYGALLPFANYGDVLFSGIIFVFALFFAGLIWTLSYSLIIVLKNKKRFYNEFSRIFLKWKYSLLVLFLLGVESFFVFGYIRGALLFLVLVIFPILYIYVKCLDKCMIVLTSPEKLTLGDWIEESVEVHGKKIKKSVDGLTEDEILFLRKFKKKVLVKQGVPFSPSFLISFAFTGCVYLILGLSLVQFFSFLF